MHNDTPPSLTNSAVADKTRELCQAIVDQPEFKEMRRSMDDFFASEAAQQQYQAVAERGERLHHKQHGGESLSQEEIEDYEKHRQALFANPVAKNFVEAQHQMQQMRESVVRYVAKTLEIGRVPTDEDFESCGHGCSCGH